MEIGREIVLTAQGKDWRAGRWTWTVWQEWLAWAKTQLPNPLDTVREQIDKWPAELQIELAHRALDKSMSATTMGSPEVSALMKSPEGVTYLLYLLLKKNHPEITLEQAFDIMVEFGADRLAQQLQKTAGDIPAPGTGGGKA